MEDVDSRRSVSEIKAKFGFGPDQRVADQAYASGEELFRNQQFDDAAKTSSKPPDAGPIEAGAGRTVPPRRERVLRQAVLQSGRHPMAACCEKYPNSPHLDKVIRRQFDIARYWEKYPDYDPHWVTTANLFDKTRPLFDTLGRSMKTYENIRLNDPTGPLADDAIMAAANSYFLRGRYNDADYQYELLRNEYPRSEHQFKAHILGLQCKLRKYQGPDYDGMPLEEAKKLVKQLKVQFAGELDPEERQQLAEIQGAAQSAIGRARLRNGQVFRRERALRQREILLCPDFARISRDADGGKSPAATRGPGRLARSSGISHGMVHRPVPRERRTQGDRASADDCPRGPDPRSPPNPRTTPPPMARRSSANAVAAAWVIRVLLPCALARLRFVSHRPRTLYAPDVDTVYVPMIESDSFRRDLGER